MNNLFIKQHAPTILTCIGAVGVIATSILSSKATLKASTLLKEAEEEKGEELTKKEVVQTVTTTYIPTIISGAATIACIFGSDKLNKRHIAIVTSAYALLNNAYNKYKDKVEAIYGKEADERIRDEIAKDEYEQYEIDDFPKEEESLFFDFVSQQYFSARIEDVIQKVTMDDGMECYIISTPFDLPASYYINL